MRKNTTEYHAYLGSRIRMKYTPTISWRLDDTPEQADRISKIIDNLNIPEDDQ